MSTVPVMLSVAYSVMVPSSLEYFLMKESRAGKFSRMYMATSRSAFCPISFSNSSWYTWNYLKLATTESVVSARCNCYRAER